MRPTRSIRTRRPAIALALAGALLAAPLALPAGAQQTAGGETPSRFLNVSGEGTVTAPPDHAVLTLGVTTTGSTAGAALRANSAEMQKVFETAKSLNIADRDIQTSTLSVSPQYRSYEPGQSGPPVIEGYVVSNQVTIRIRALDTIGSALDAFVSSGANEMSGLHFDIEDVDALIDEARRKAVADAQHRAKVLSEAAGVTLGPVETINEHGGYRPVAESMSMARMKDSAVPVAAGEMSLSVSVSMTYRIQ